MGCIGLAVLLALIYAYVIGIIEMLNFLPYIIAMVIICVVTCVVQGQNRNKGLSDAQKKKIAEAEELDRKNAQLNAEEGKKWAKAEAKKVIEVKSEQLAPLMQRHTDLRRELQQHIDAVNASDVLGANEKNIEAIDFLLEKIEGRRANSITDALNLWDAKKDADEERKRREAWMRLQEDIRMRERQWEAQRILDASLEQLAHNSRMEAEARRAADAAEQAQRDQEFYLRYGKL